MGSQVAVAEVAVVPTFKGFRKLVTAETDGAAKSATSGFSRAFAKTGNDTGKATGSGFKKAFEQSAKGTSDKVAKALEADVAKASRALSAARLKEQDAIGKVRVAQAQLNEANKKYAADSSQVIRAQERLATASRQLESAHEGTERATDDLKRSQSELARAADRAGDELAQAGDRGVTGFRSNVIGGVKSFAAPLIAAFAALGIGNIVADAFDQAKDFVLESISIASDLNESVNAVQVTYGDAADEVLKLGENSAKAFGLSNNELNAYATQFSSFVKTIAGSGGDVAGTLEQLIGRGTDFASVMNLDVADALEVFQSGLAGETEPLRKYGIDLSAATVEQYAYANGIAAAGEQLTEAQKVQARYGALLQQTNQVAGDFVNTQDELANRNRTNAAVWEDIQAKLGAGFLPVAEELAGIIGDDLLPVIGALAEEEGPKLAEAFADILPDLTEIAKDLLPQLPFLFEQAAETLPELISLLGLLIPLFVDGANNASAFITGVGALFSFLAGDTTLTEFAGDLLGLQGPLASVWQWAMDAGSKIGVAFFNAKQWVQQGINDIVAFVTSLPTRAAQALVDIGGVLVQAGKDLMGGFLKGIEAMTKPIGDAVSGVLDWVAGFFPHSPAKRGPFSGSGWSQLRKSGEAFWEQWVGGMGDEGPGFPEFPGGGPFPAPGTAGGGGAPRGGVVVNQSNTYAHEDPQVAAQLARDQLDHLLRSY